MLVKEKATIDDLYRVRGKAELINGEIRTFMPTGRQPARAAFRVTVSLDNYVLATALPGFAVSDGVGFLVNLPNRQSFSPDAAYFVGNDPGMKFFSGAPQFAVEVRSENDYGPAKDSEYREKRDDYFAAGTLVVWDVDLLNEPIVRKYTTPDAVNPSAVFRRGEIADAEPAVPGWTLLVDDLFS